MSNFNSFPVSANIIYAIDGRGHTTTAHIRAKSDKTICNLGIRSRVYAKVTFTIQDYYTGKTETITASESNYSIGSLTARGSP